MISLSESSFSKPQDSAVPTDEDLNNYGLTREQYDIWKKNNSDSRLRKFDKWFYNPKTLMVMGTLSALNGNYVSAANKINYMLPEEVEKRNRYYINQDLAAARKHYDSKTAAAGK